ncbi:MAG TPA: glutamate--tRNA ligase family protein [Candidatus Saccharimonadales bacterium]|nr:glutamate--tRNA ligase family protein [Candidatus Saccharimonadales bacterium]
MVRTRIAPSPTGNPHIGTIYQALFDYVFARKYDGKFILRIEDTDRVRLVEGAEAAVLEALTWFGLTPNESPNNPGDVGPYRQSERKEAGIYKEYMFGPKGLVNRFIPTDMLPETQREINNQNHYCAYYCFCTKERLDKIRLEQQAQKKVPRYDKFCLKITREEAIERSKTEDFVIRLNIPRDYTIEFDDSFIGKIKVTGIDVDDQVLLKSDGYPTYHFGVVVDDHLMNISHVFRGKEWLPSTPKHIILYYYFNWSRPIYIHLPLILNSDGKGKLSKRHGHSSVNYYREEGYLPQAILNYLANIVWNHPEGNEIFSLNEFIEKLHINKIIDAEKVYANTNMELKSIISLANKFDEEIDRFITSQAPRFDLDKLQWINGIYIREKMSSNELLNTLKKYEEDFGESNSSLNQIDDNILLRIVELAQPRINTLKEFYPLITQFLPDAKFYVSNDAEKEIAKSLQDAFERLDTWNKDTILEVLREILKKHSIRMPILYTIVTGQMKGLPLPESLEILGKETVLTRLQKIV